MVLAAWSGVRPERTPRWWFFALCVPTALDALAPWIGLAGLSNVPRFLLAGPTGFILGWFLAAAVRDRAAMGLERRPSARAPAARARSA